MIAVSYMAQVGTAWRSFSYSPSVAGVAKVNIAGTFNNWNKDATPLAIGPDGKTWTTKIKLPFGRTQYKFVLNGSQWILDPKGIPISDGNGNTNSEVVVTPPDYDIPASPTDGVIANSALLHVPAEPQLNYDRGALRIQFRARPNDLSEVDLLLDGKTIPMTEVSHDEVFATYSSEFKWDQKTDLSYDFRLKDGPLTAYYGKDGFSKFDPPKFVLAAKTFKPFEVPNWVDRTVVYQIFPDRFENGDHSNDPKDVQPPNAKPTYSNRFGGDAVGVQKHLDYLKSLGVGAVYFNPVFQSPSNHRYDTTDYRKIDPEFGSNSEFESLTQAMKANGIRTVMDFAFNHTATNFFAFQDVRDKGSASPYTPWYFIKSFPVTVKKNPPYVAWFDYPSMPKFNTVNPDTEKYILGSVDYWIDHANLAGVRLDVANEVDMKLWRDLRLHVKSKLPNFWIVGEEWGDANPWLKGDQWDSTMGYQFREACLGFFATQSSTATQFLDRLTSIYQSYPPQVSRNLMNLIGSHDTARFLTLCKGDLGLLKLAATVQLTWPGTPCIYYGDEIGMQGGADPDNRRMMDWSTATSSNPTLVYYQLLIHARNSSVALQEGDPILLTSNDQGKCFAYARVLGDHAALVAINASDQPQTISIDLSTEKGCSGLNTNLTDIVGRKTYSASNKLVLELSPKGAAVLLPTKEQAITPSLMGLQKSQQPHLSGHRSPTTSQGAK